MGMFDTINVKIYDTLVGVQTKHYDNVLETFNWLDVVDQQNYLSPGVSSLIENWEEFGREMWFSFILVNGVYVDYSMAPTLKEAQEAEKILLTLWSDSEAQNLVLATCAHIERLQNHSNFKSHLQLRKFFLNYESIQTDKAFYDKYLAGNLSIMEKLQNPSVFDNDFIDEKNKAYISLKKNVLNKITDLKNPVLTPIEQQQITAVVDHFPLPLVEPYRKVEDAMSDNFIGIGNAMLQPLNCSPDIYEAKENLLKKLHTYALKKIKLNPELAQSFVYSRLFNSNQHPVFKAEINKLSNFTLDYHNYYPKFIDYLFMIGENFERIKSIASSPEELEKAMLDNAIFIVGNTQRLSAYLTENKPSLDFKRRFISIAQDLKSKDMIKSVRDYAQDTPTLFVEILTLILQQTPINEANSIIFEDLTLAGLLVKELYENKIKNSTQETALSVLIPYAKENATFSPLTGKNTEIIQSFKTQELFQPLFAIYENAQFEEIIEVKLSNASSRIKKI